MNIYAVCCLIFLGMGSLNLLLGGITLYSNFWQTVIMVVSGLLFIIIGLIMTLFVPDKFKRMEENQE